ncbi:MAG: HAMP domain-containing protein [Phycisphaerales bacterium]|nr:MAG: HAMP domain-containing protein [Phycisphaerales bacterium]
MSLQRKFRFLLAVFAVSVVANVLVSIWCIQFYLGNAATQFSEHMRSASETSAVRSKIDKLIIDLDRFAGAPDEESAPAIQNRCAECAQHLGRLAQQHAEGPLTPDRGQLVSLADKLPDLCAEYLDLAGRSSPDHARPFLRQRIEHEWARPLRSALALLSGADDHAISSTTIGITNTQTRVIALLSANAVAAFLLAGVGVFLVRNWVLKPVDALNTATEQHAQGNLAYRIDDHTNDELGALSRAMNRMADSLIDIQKQLMQQERLAALGEVASMVAHNIRNPLAGIRASAQSAMSATDEQSQSHLRQRQIVETVDSLNQWLKQLLLVNRPLTLDRRRTPVREMVDAVLTAQRSNAQRRGITLKYQEADGGCCVHADPRHIEQAIQVLVDNALDASPPRSEVTITARPAAATDRWVDLIVRDRGSGIPNDVRDRITAPYFTTKPGGTGIGLHLAKKAVESHGGEILFDCPDSGGTAVTLRLPTRDLIGGRDGQDPARG